MRRHGADHRHPWPSHGVAPSFGMLAAAPSTQLVLASTSATSGVAAALDLYCVGWSRSDTGDAVVHLPHSSDTWLHPCAAHWGRAWRDRVLQAGGRGGVRRQSYMVAMLQGECGEPTRWRPVELVTERRRPPPPDEGAAGHEAEPGVGRARGAAWAMRGMAMRRRRQCSVPNTMMHTGTQSKTPACAATSSG